MTKNNYSQGNRCSCGKLITNNNWRCQSCAKKGKFNPNYGKSHKGKKNPAWKGGKYKDSRDGRIYIHAPENPMVNQRGYVRRSRLVMSKKLGRSLKPEEIVHHIDGISSNDDLENLWLFKNRGEHKGFEGNQCKLLVEKLVKLEYISEEEIYKILRTILKRFCVK